MAPLTDGDLVLVDPDGDLILKVGSERSITHENKCNSPDNEDDSNAAQHEVKEIKQPKTLRIRVCSKFMTMCSPVFERMLNGSFRESQLTPNPVEPPVLELPEDAPTSMLELCRIFHHTWDTSLDAFPSCVLPIAIAADKYGCHKIARAWFHYRAFRNASRRSTCSILDLARLISISYILDDVGAFYFFSVEGYKSWRTKKGQNDEFISEISRYLPARVHELLKEIAKAQLKALRASCHNAISELCMGNQRYRDGAIVHSTIFTRTEEFTIPVVCKGQAARVAQYIQALFEVDLWLPGRGGGGPASLEAAICIVRQIAARSNDGPVNCDSVACVSCFISWESAVQDVADSFENELRGICLVCLKRGDLSTSKLQTGCNEHQGESTLGWFVAWSQTTRDYETLED
ncbi:hypothetical protein AYL99_02576 [Fonsecaea erecta]|uniref:BTB domain-containing protein n=1 Tax=Fonsecaea erecta TaxID=1367422 RepID=A0A178ZUA8_9EURO|nr:hypothetical protein AYL99_02576 [Fonsecaea erecta]OAP63349.1 hypothetical protein AYL99_02576 [Fonsecaea erecta]